MILAAAAILGCAYFIFFKDRDDFLYPLGAALLVLMITYVFQYQIDQLMTRGVPQVLPGAMRAMLMNTTPHYIRLSEGQQRLVEDRMHRWIQKKEFISQNKQEPPEDVKYILAYYAVLLTIHQEKYLYDGLDRIVFYHHPFLTPGHNEEVHIVEVESKDGTIIISVPDMLKGHLEKGYYNIALHTMAIAYKEVYMNKDVAWPEDIWHQLELISGISKERLEDYIGMPLNDPWPVAVHHQVTYSNSHIPEVVEVLPQLGGK